MLGSPLWPLGVNQRLWCLYKHLLKVKTRAHTLRTCKPVIVSSFPDWRNLSTRHLVNLTRPRWYFMHKARQNLRLHFSNTFTHTARQGVHMCWAWMLINSLRKEFSQTLGDPKVLHFWSKKSNHLHHKTFVKSIRIPNLKHWYVSHGFGGSSQMMIPM